MEVRCALCGRWFKTAQGRRGHLNFYHGQARETPYTSAIRQAIYLGKNGVKMQKEEMIKDKPKNKASKGEGKEEKKEKPEPEFRDITPKDEDDAIERYVDRIPDVFVDKYKQYLNMHKEDDELTRRYPDDFEKSVRVLPMEKEGTRYLRTISTDEKKTEDFHRFLKDGKFRVENENVEGVERKRVLKIIDRLERRIKGRLRE